MNYPGTLSHWRADPETGTGVFTKTTFPNQVMYIMFYISVIIMNVSIRVQC